MRKKFKNLLDKTEYLTYGIVMAAAIYISMLRINYRKGTHEKWITVSLKTFRADGV